MRSFIAVIAFAGLAAVQALPILPPVDLSQLPETVQKTSSDVVNDAKKTASDVLNDTGANNVVASVDQLTQGLNIPAVNDAESEVGKVVGAVNGVLPRQTLPPLDLANVPSTVQKTAGDVVDDVKKTASDLLNDTGINNVVESVSSTAQGLNNPVVNDAMSEVGKVAGAVNSILPGRQLIDLNGAVGDVKSTVSQALQDTGLNNVVSTVDSVTGKIPGVSAVEGVVGNVVGPVGQAL